MRENIFQVGGELCPLLVCIKQVLRIVFTGRAGAGCGNGQIFFPLSGFVCAVCVVLFACFAGFVSLFSKGFDRVLVGLAGLVLLTRIVAINPNRRVRALNRRVRMLNRRARLFPYTLYMC